MKRREFSLSAAAVAAGAVTLPAWAQPREGKDHGDDQGRDEDRFRQPQQKRADGGDSGVGLVHARRKICLR